MANYVQTAHSVAAISQEAAIDIVKQIQSAETELPLQFCLVFCGIRHRLDPLLKSISKKLGQVHVHGCTTNGEFTESAVSDEGVAAFAVFSDNMTITSAVEQGMDSPEVLASRLSQSYNATQAIAKKERQLHGTAILLTDGLVPTGERIVKAMSKETSAFLQFVGGAAGDDGSMQKTCLGTEYQTGNNLVAALQIFSTSRIGLGLGHGLVPTGEAMRVTRADGNRIYEINGEPAAIAYRKRLAERGVEFMGHGDIPYFVGNELGIYFLNSVNRARAVLRIEADESLICAGDVPNHAKVCFLDSDVENLVSAAQEAAREAKGNLGGRKAAGAVLFDCACRKGILGDDFQREVAAVSEELGGVPVAGFMTYGEIAKYSRELVGWHNTTAVVMVIPSE